jgi:hypothetical protein
MQPVNASAWPAVAQQPQKMPPNQAKRPKSPLSKRNPTDLLRSTARRLEDLAADLEAANLYEQADQIREQAGKFWLKAREIQGRSN